MTFSGKTLPGRKTQAIGDPGMLELRKDARGAACRRARLAGGRSTPQTERHQGNESARFSNASAFLTLPMQHNGYPAVMTTPPDEFPRTSRHRAP